MLWMDQTGGDLSSAAVPYTGHLGPATVHVIQLEQSMWIKSQ